MSKPQCSTAECTRPQRCGGYCNAHYLRVRKYGDPRPDLPLKERSAGRLCQTPACSRPVRCKDLCASHYSMKLVYGRTEAITSNQRFWAKVTEDGDGCWIWTGAIGSGGYGNFYNQGRPGGSAASPVQVAHRFSYETMRSNIPSGLELDHLCRVRACVNPWHLEPVAPHENIRRAAIAWGLTGRAAMEMIEGYAALRARIVTASNLENGEEHRLLKNTRTAD
jgi:hypothetical protein